MTSLAASLPLPAPPQPQSIVELILDLRSVHLKTFHYFSLKDRKALGKNHYFISSEKYLEFLNITHLLVCVYMLLIISVVNLHHCWNPHKVCPLHLADASLVPFSL